MQFGLALIEDGHAARQALAHFDSAKVETHLREGRKKLLAAPNRSPAGEWTNSQSRVRVTTNLVAIGPARVGVNAMLTRVSTAGSGPRANVALNAKGPP